MRYLESFESMDQDPLYHEISFDEWDAAIAESICFSNSEFAEISRFLKDRGGFSIRLTHSSPLATGAGEYSYIKFVFNRSFSPSVPTAHSDVEINMTNDEWYFVNVGLRLFYKCDQVNGLYKLLEYLAN